MLKKALLFFLTLGLLATAITGYSLWRDNLPLISPLSFLELQVNQPTVKDRLIYGFFPYWNLKYADKLHIDQLTHFAYFAVDMNPDGTPVKKINSKELEPGWNKLHSSALSKIIYQTKLLGQKSVITFTAMDPDTIESILTNPTHKETAISSIIEIYRDHKFQGINIDFEYVGSPSQSTRDSFVDLVSHIKSRCMIINPSCEVDVDVFGDTARKNRLHDLKKLSSVADHVIVMTYDYYRKSSSQAGPIAPLRGACQTFEDTKCLEQDIVTNITEISQLVPSTKIILGIPFYGYQWQTASSEFLSNTYPGTGSLATYQRTMSIFQDSEISSLSAKWSATTLSPYLTFEQDKSIYQIHFEDPQSLELKLDLVRNANLGGIAIWAIGYEVPYLDIWQPIADYRKSP